MNDSYWTSRHPDYSSYKIGAWTYGYPKVLSWGEGATLTMGKYCSIADDVTILLGGEHRTDWITTYPFNFFWEEAKHFKGHPKTRGDIVIENDVWIGRCALILSGVKIGNGAVIGAEAVVTKDVEPYTIVAGNPARAVRQRFSPEQIQALQRIAWWNWSEDKIFKHLPLLLSGNIEKFISECQALPQE